MRSITQNGVGWNLYIEIEGTEAMATGDPALLRGCTPAWVPFLASLLPHNSHVAVHYGAMRVMHRCSAA